MPIPIIAEIVPQNNGAFATHISTFGAGGWHEVADIAERDAIPRARRRAGMAVNVLDPGIIFLLGADLQTWGQIVLTGVEDAPVTGEAYVRQNAGWTDLKDILDGGVYAY